VFVRTVAAIALLAAPQIAGAQSLLDRSPNVSGDWVGASGTLYFHFVHRFRVSGAPERKVSNVPTFLVGAGLPKRFFAGFNYSTNSTLTPNFPNEWEVFGRWAPLSEDLGAPVEVGGQVGYNNAADGVDGEVSIAKRLGIARLILAGRALSDPLEDGNVKFAVAGGATLRLNQYVALAGDIASLADRDSAEKVSWSAGLHVAIPLTPHTFSLHASNAPVSTLQGASRGTSDVRFGFEFTIPLTLRRYFGKREESSPDTAVSAAAVPVDTAVESKAVETAVAPAPTPAAPAPARTTTAEKPKPAPAKPAPAKRPSSVRRTTIKNISYLQPRITVSVGTTVEWSNSDPLPHTVTASDRSFNSGLIQPGKTYRHTFTKAGTFNYYCVPHPFMKGAIVVTP
jgi:plastocyanin